MKRTVTAAAIRRRGRRRVADENRKRAPKACDRCKTRKSKCIVSAPGICQGCSAVNLPCTFEREERVTKKVHPEGELSALSEEITVSPKHPAPSGAIENGASRISIETNQLERIPWPKFRSHLLEVFSLDQEDDLDDEDLPTSQVIGRPTTLHPADLVRLQVAIDAFPPRNVADFLLTICTTYSADNFFFFDQARLLADIDQFYTNPTSPLRTDASFVCLALAAFALGSQRTPLVRTRGLVEGMYPDDGDSGQIFYNQARGLVVDVIERSCLRAIQAIFALGVYLLPQTAVGSSYVYIGIALRKAVASDFHHLVDDSTVDAHEREAQHRFWWSIYSLERTLTVKLNQPRSICVDIITTPLPSPLPSMDILQKFDNVQHQLANARVVKILDRIADLSSSNDTTDSTSREAISKELKEWKKSLASNCRLENLRPRDLTYRAVVHLYMNYYSAHIAMGKVSLVASVRAKLRHRFGRQTQQSDITEATEKLSESCIKSAMKLLRLLENLARTGNMARFSFTDFQACSTATVVVIIAFVLDRDSIYENRIIFGLECLHKMAVGNVAALSAVRYVETLRSIASKAAAKLDQTDTPPPGSDDFLTPAIGVKYREWTEWLSKAQRSQSECRLGGPNVGSVSQPDIWYPYATSGNGDASRNFPPEAMPSSSPLPQIDTQGTSVPCRPLGAGDDFLSAPYYDDQTFLLGMTGLDVFDFSTVINDL